MHCFRIARGKKYLKLMRFETLRCRFIIRPKSEFPRRKALLHEPEPLSIIRQTLYGGFPSIPENKQTAGKRILLQCRFADPCKSIDSIPKIDGFNRHQNPHLRRDLDQGLSLQNALLRAFRSKAFMPLIWIRILSPHRFSSSMEHS